MDKFSILNYNFNDDELFQAYFHSCLGTGYNKNFGTILKKCKRDYINSLNLLNFRQPIVNGLTREYAMQFVIT